MEREFRIESDDRDSAVSIALDEPEIFLVRVSGPQLSAFAGVYHDRADGIAEYFKDLAAAWRGWRGAKEWCSVEGTLRFSATCDRTGHVSLAVQLDDAVPYSWRVSLVVMVEAGHLEALARGASALVQRLIRGR